MQAEEIFLAALEKVTPAERQAYFDGSRSRACCAHPETGPMQQLAGSELRARLHPSQTMFSLLPPAVVRSLAIGVAMITLAAALVGSYCLGYHHGVHDKWYGPPAWRSSLSMLPG